MHDFGTMPNHVYVHQHSLKLSRQNDVKIACLKETSARHLEEKKSRAKKLKLDKY